MSLQTENQSRSQLDQKIRNAKEMSTQYTECYDNYGRFLVDQEAGNIFLNTILENIPENYYGVDIGSCDGRFGDEIMEKKKGKIISVDPFPTNKNVIESRGQDFIKLYENEFDFVIMKYSIHLFGDLEQFYKDLTKALKPNGKIFLLLICCQECRLPFTKTIQKGFDESNKNYNPNFFNHEIQEIIVENVVKVLTKYWKGLLQGRGFSNLLQHSEEEIQENIDSLPKTQEVEVFWKHKIVVAKSKNQN